MNSSSARVCHLDVATLRRFIQITPASGGGGGGGGGYKSYTVYTIQLYIAIHYTSYATPLCPPTAASA